MLSRPRRPARPILRADVVANTNGNEEKDNVLQWGERAIADQQKENNWNKDQFSTQRTRQLHFQPLKKNIAILRRIGNNDQVTINVDLMISVESCERKEENKKS